MRAIKHCGQNAALQNFKADSTYNYYSTSQGAFNAFNDACETRLKLLAVELRSVMSGFATKWSSSGCVCDFRTAEHKLPPNTSPHVTLRKHG
jgi:hypothetical protein